jgi:two-component system invasion response regulator UvrY
MLASGKTVSEVALLLSLSVKTVSTHRTRILKKMEMRTNAELMHYAMRQGLVE